jgi:hypothetical protein
MPIKFDTIKANAARIYTGTMGNFDRSQMTTMIAGPLGPGTPGACAAILPFILASRDEREEMRAFAEAFEAVQGDWLALSAKSDGKNAAWHQVVLRAREAGLKLIKNWDVRKVVKLIELFPESAPARYRGKQLTCYEADNENCDWMVDVTVQPKQLTHAA